MLIMVVKKILYFSSEECLWTRFYQNLWLSFIKILSFDWVGFYWKIPLSFEWVIIWVSYFFRAFGAVLSYDWVIIWKNKRYPLENLRITRHRIFPTSFYIFSCFLKKNCSFVNCFRIFFKLHFFRPPFWSEKPSKFYFWKVRKKHQYSIFFQFSFKAILHEHTFFFK